MSRLRAWFRPPPIRAAGVVAWLLVSVTVLLAWVGGCSSLEDGEALDVRLILTIPSAVLAWRAFALAGDVRFHPWMAVVQTLGSGLFVIIGLLALGAHPSQGPAICLTSIGMAYVFTRPPRLPQDVGNADGTGGSSAGNPRAADS